MPPSGRRADQAERGLVYQQSRDLGQFLAESALVVKSGAEAAGEQFLLHRLQQAASDIDAAPGAKGECRIAGEAAEHFTEDANGPGSQLVLRLAAGDLLRIGHRLCAADRVIDVEQAGAAEQTFVGYPVIMFAEPGEDFDLLIAHRREIGMAAFARNHRRAASPAQDRANAET